MAAKVVINVSNAAQLAAAIRTVKGGETILLAPGEYGSVAIKGRMLATNVTIQSADPSRDAVITDLRIDKSRGFTFNDVDIHRPLKPGEPDFVPAVYVSNSQRLTFTGVDFSGSLDNNPWNDGMGLRVSSSSDIRVLDSTFQQFNVAAGFSNNSRILIAGNTVNAVREGFDFAAVDNVTIAQNHFSGFKPNYAAGDHSDSIQFWNNGVSRGSSQIVIRDNVILQGANGGTQGIFIRAENLALKHSDFVLENNLYNGDARHGITLLGVDGAVVRGNTVTTAVGGRLEAGINLGDTSQVVVERNIAPLLINNGKNTGLVMRDNIDLYDTASKSGLTLASIFAKPPAGIDTGAYALKAGGAAALAKAGFAGFDGIGAASFDLAHAASYTHISAMLG